MVTERTGKIDAAMNCLDWWINTEASMPGADGRPMGRRERIESAAAVIHKTEGFDDSHMAEIRARAMADLGLSQAEADLL